MSSRRPQGVFGRIGGCVAVILLGALPLPRLWADRQKIEFGVHRKMTAVLMTPDGPGPFPGILLLHTAGGLESADLDYAQRLTREGYVVLAPYFLRAYPAFTLLKIGRREIFTTNGQSIYDDFVDGLSLLRAHPRVRGRKVGAIGFSAGGYFAVWLAATNQVQAAVSYYGALTAAGGDDDWSDSASCSTGRALRCSFCTERRISRCPSRARSGSMPS